MVIRYRAFSPHVIDQFFCTAREERGLSRMTMTEATSVITAPSAPEMSVILVTPDRFETLRETVEHLRAQTAKDRLEIVIVAPSEAELALDPAELDGFAGHV